jgi:hypothetical protein
MELKDDCNLMGSLLPCIHVKVEIDGEIPGCGEKLEEADSTVILSTLLHAIAQMNMIMLRLLLGADKVECLKGKRNNIEPAHATKHAADLSTLGIMMAQNCTWQCHHWLYLPHCESELSKNTCT